MKRLLITLIAAAIVMCGATVSNAETVKVNDDGTYKVETVSYVDVEAAEFNWVNVSEESTEIADGVVQKKIISVQKDGNGQNTSYICTVDLSKGAKIVTTSNYIRGESTEGKLSGGKLVKGLTMREKRDAFKLTKMTDQAKAVSEKRGMKAVAAINGDFFKMETGEPNGIVMSDGIVYNNIWKTSNENTYECRNFFAITNKDKAAIVNSKAQAKFLDTEKGTYDYVKDGAYKEAIGGDLIILKQVSGQARVIKQKTNEHRDTFHARCAIGLKADGSVVMFTTSGQLGDSSTGLTYQEVAVILSNEGCTRALMLDGGGSTTFASDTGNGLTVRNCPADGDERLVADGLAVLSDAAVSESILTECERNGHEYILDQGKVTCANCDLECTEEEFTGIAAVKGTDKCIYCVEGKRLKGFKSYDNDSCYYFNSDGIGKKCELAESVANTCTKSGYRVYIDKESGNTLKVDNQKPYGHVYDENGVCENCGWHQISPYDCDMSLSFDTCTYSGKAKYPDVEVKAGDTVLADPEHYSLVYHKNCDIGTASVDVVPKYHYSGDNIHEKGSLSNNVRTLTFEILPPMNPVKTSVSYDRATLSWDAVAGVDGYRIYGYDSSKDGYVLKEAVSDASCTLTGLKPGNEYKYRVRSYKTVDGRDYESFYKSAAVKTKALDVTGLSASPSTSSVKLSWKKCADASGYKVYRYDSSKKAYVLKKTVKGPSTLSYTGKTLKSGTTYTYKVCAYRNIDGKAVCGNEVKIKVNTKPLKVKSLKLSARDNGFKASWSKKTCTGYQVRYSTSKNFSSYKTATVSKSSTAYKTVSKLKNKKKYYVKVRAYRSCDGGKTSYGSWSTVKSVKTK